MGTFNAPLPDVIHFVRILLGNGAKIRSNCCMMANSCRCLDR